MAMKDSEVWRGGALFSSMKRERESKIEFLVEGKDPRTAALICTTIPSKGGGNTTVHLRVPPSDFHDLIALLYSVDPVATRRAFAQCILDWDEASDEG